MKLDGLSDEAADFVTTLADSDTAREIGNMSAPTRIAALNNDHVAKSGHHGFSLLRPACFNTEFSVPGGTSKLGFPATVTVPGFARMLILSMATPRTGQTPAIFFEQADEIGDLHSAQVHCGCLPNGSALSGRVAVGAMSCDGWCRAARAGC